VVIPTYQRRSLVIGSVESVVAQDCPPDEVIVVDDGSTDGTADSLRRFFGDRVFVLEQDNRGPSAARNAGIRTASGNVIAFNDSDNRWLPHHLTLINGLLNRYPNAALVSTQRSYRFGKEEVSQAGVRDMAEDLLLTIASVGLLSCVAVRREAFESAGGFDEDIRYGEDTDLFLRLSLLGPFSLMAAATVQWNRYSDSLRDEGLRRGGYIGTLGATGKRILQLLEVSDRPDAANLRAAAAARVAIGAIFEGLAVGAPASQLRPWTAEIRRLAPRLMARPRSVLGLLPSTMPGWENPAYRVRRLTKLLRAWPPTMSAGYLQLWAATLWIAFHSPPSFQRPSRRHL
jgi:hypothetical protein